jgi:adenylate kinase
MLNLIILGPQGAGKGTQAQLLAKDFGLVWIETGRLLRERAWDGTRLGEKIGKLLNQGVLVPDDIVTQIIKEKIIDVPKDKGIVLDGYPRNSIQLENLEKILKEQSRAKYKAIFVKVSKKTTLKRLAGRKTCSKCGKIFSKTDQKTCPCGGKLIVRADDRPKAIEKRLEVYHKETKPILRFYRKKGVLVEINGERSIEKVYQDILKALKP